MTFIGAPEKRYRDEKRQDSTQAASTLENNGKENLFAHTMTIFLNVELICAEQHS
jgi:hypothetical protein